MAAHYWDAVVDELIRAGMFQDSDRYVLVEIVEAYAMAVRFRHAMNVALETSVEDGGGLLGRQAERARIGYEKYTLMWKGLAAEFGLTPVARLRLGLGQIKAATLMEALGDLPG